MRPNIAAQARTLLGKGPFVRIPHSWFAAIRNHTALVLLADILSAYSGDALDRVWDGDELLLEYKLMAERFGVSSRTISRTVDVLFESGAIDRSQLDRKVRGRVMRNIVGVIPSIELIAKFSGVAPGDILSARGTAPAVPSRGARVPLPSGQPAGVNVPLTDLQDAVVRAYEDEFSEIVGTPYRTNAMQHLADLRAIARLAAPKQRGGGRKYSVWARQYLKALKAKGEAEHGDVRKAAFDRRGDVTGRFSIEAFVFWAKSNANLPEGSARRALK